ncbi:MAG: hypothetical protein ACI9UA_000492, partial [Pseudoalteromonas tetraodonis]
LLEDAGHVDDADLEVLGAGRNKCEGADEKGAEDGSHDDVVVVLVLACADFVLIRPVDCVVSAGRGGLPMSCKNAF